MAEETRVAVIGAGVTGLCVAHYASRAFGADSVVVLEAAGRAGGQTRTDAADGFVCDWGPNGFLDRQPLTLQWIGDLGLSDALLQCDASAARRFIVKDERILEIVPPPRFFLSPLLSIKGRLRLCCEPLIKAKRDDAPETIWDFAARRIGPEAADMMVTPMVSGVFGGDAKRASLAHCFPRMAGMEKEYGGLVRALIAKKREDPEASPMGPRGVLTSFKQGIGFVADEAAEQLGARIRCGARVKSVTRNGAGYRVALEQGDAVDAQAVVVACPAHAAAPLMAGLDEAAGKALAAIPYADLAVVCAGYRRERVGHDLHGFGFLVPRNQGKRLLGCLWTSSIFAGRAPEGHVHLRMMFGGATDPEAVRLSDNELLACVEREVHPLLRIDGGAPDFVRIYRHAPGIPQYLLDHGAHLEALTAAEKNHPGLVFAGNAYRGVALNDCVVSAQRALCMLQSECGGCGR